MSDLGIFSILGDIMSLVTSAAPIVLAAALWWLKSQFPTKADFEGLQKEVRDLASAQGGTNQRLDAMERDMDDPPTRLELLKALSALEARTASIESSQNGLGRQLSTLNDYVHTVIQRGLAK